MGGEIVGVCSPAFRRRERGREIHAVGKQTKACTTNGLLRSTVQEPVPGKACARL